TISGNVFRIASQPPAEASSRQIVGRPDRLPWREEGPAVLAQLRPLREIAHLRRAKQQPVAARREVRRRRRCQSKQGHSLKPLHDRPARSFVAGGSFPSTRFSKFVLLRSNL